MTMVEMAVATEKEEGDNRLPGPPKKSRKENHAEKKK